MKKLPSTARGVATTVLHRVARDGAWATPTLDAEIRRAELSRRDAGLATAIVYGALRTQRSLDELLDAHLREPEALDDWTKAALRVAAFQLRHLPRIPPRAAVHEAVDIVRAVRGENLARLTNAVLRKIRRPEDAAPPERVEVAPWIAAALVRSLGEERAAQLTRPTRLPPPIDLRVAEDTDPDELARRIAEAHPEAEVARVGDRSLRLSGAGDPRALPGWEEGAFIVQELGSQHAVDALDAQPGERIADACAGRGGKTLALLEQVGAEGAVVALELHEARLDQLRSRHARTGGGGRLETVAVDLRVGLAGLEPTFDRVLVDAPCTGLGTLGRRPELAWRLRPEDLESVTETQAAILDQAAGLVKPGGLLQLVVCSPLTEEGPAIGERFLEAHPDFVPDPAPGADPDGTLRLGPWNVGDGSHPTDAYQILRWRRPR